MADFENISIPFIHRSLLQRVAQLQLEYTQVINTINAIEINVSTKGNEIPCEKSTISYPQETNKNGHEETSIEKQEMCGNMKYWHNNAKMPKLN